MQTLQDVKTWRGQKAVDREGGKIGKIDEIYLDRHSGEPEWATVSTGLFGMRTSFVPIRDASMSGDGEVRLPFTKDQIKDAPNIDVDGELSVDEEQRLYRHYGRADYGDWDQSTDRTEGLGLAGDRDDRFRREDDDVRGRRAGTETGDAMADDAMTRSEEELHVGTERRETGRARLRKYVVTEDVTTTVPVQREEVRIEREPITDENVDAAMRGPEITEAEHEVILEAEEPVVEKRTVPKERVRLQKDTVRDEKTVGGEVRRERIETDGVDDDD
jgi:uncharacterized protein (TIGR02271 family)